MRTESRRDYKAFELRAKTSRSLIFTFKVKLSKYHSNFSQIVEVFDLPF